MIKFGDKEWKNLDDLEKISYCKDNFVDPAKSERQSTEAKWYVSKSFLDGKHYASYNTVTNTIETPPRNKRSIRLVINKTRWAMRSVQNFTTRYQPKFECVPGDLDDETIKNARRSGKLLDYLHTQLHLRMKIRVLVGNGLSTSVGFWELGWDDTAMGGMGQVTVDNHDPFDIFLPLTTYIEGPIIHAPFIGKVISKNVAEIHADERYPKKEREAVVPDEELALSTMKSKILRREGQKGTREEGQQTALLYEIWLYDPEGNDKDGNIKIVTFAGDKLLRDEDLELTEYPIYIFQPEPSSRLYNPSWVQDLVPINKAIDRLQSQILEYNNEMLRGRFMGPKGHGINVASIGRGVGAGPEMWEYNSGFPIEQVPMHPLPLTVHRQNDDLNRAHEDGSGSHEASMGVNPSGGRSGKALEALQAADSNNLSGIRESLEDFLSVVGSRILDIVADKYVASRVVKLTDPEEGGQGFMKVAGEAAGEAPEGTTIVNKDNEVIVKIGSNLGYTREAQRETLLELKSAGIVPADEVLRQFEFPNIEEMSRKAKEERLEEAEMQADIAGRRGEGGAPGAPGAQGGMPAPDVVLADQENARMMQGEQLPPTPNASEEHSQAHVNFMRSPDARGQGLQVIEQHVRGELEGIQ